MLLLGAYFPGISKDSIMKGCFIHNQGGKLCDISTTCHVDNPELCKPKRLNPSLANPILTFLGSTPNSEYLTFRSFHASASAGCRNLTSSTRLPECHHISFATFSVMYNLWNLGMIGKWWRTLAVFLCSFAGSSFDFLAAEVLFPIFYLDIFHLGKSLYICSHCSIGHSL